jgi:hypothetical protein
MFFPLVKILVENTLGDFSSLLWMGGFFLGIVFIYFPTLSFSLISATSSYADDIAHT